MARRASFLIESTTAAKRVFDCARAFFVLVARAVLILKGARWCVSADPWRARDSRCVCALDPRDDGGGSSGGGDSLPIATVRPTSELVRVHAQARARARVCATPPRSHDLRVLDEASETMTAGERGGGEYDEGRAAAIRTRPHIDERGEKESALVGESAAACASSTGR